MKLFANEARKLLGMRFFLFAVGILLVAHVALAATGIETPDRSLLRTVDELCREYDADSEAYLSKYANLQRTIMEQTNAHFQEMAKENKRRIAAGEEELSPDEFQYHSYVIDGRNEDTYILFYMNSLIENAENFKEDVGGVISRAYAMMLEGRYSGMTIDDYSYKYQALAYDRYMTLYNETSLSPGNVYGWGEFFSYNTGDIFVFALILLSGALIFYPEKQQGMLPILVSTKRGRAPTAIAKAGVALALSLLLALLFTASTYLVIAVKCGFSSPDVPIQSVAALRLFPYTVSIGQYLMLFLLSKLAAALIFAACVLFFASLFSGPVAGILTGGALLLLSYLMNEGFFRLVPELQRLNLFAFSGVTKITDRLYLLNVFGRPVEYVTVLFALTVILTLLLAFFAVLLFVKMRRGMKQSKLTSLLLKIKNAFSMLGGFMTALRLRLLKKKKKRAVFRGLFLWEGVKALKYMYVWLLLILLLGAQIGIGLVLKKDVGAYYDHLIYVDLIKDVKGEANKELVEQVKEECDKITETIASSQEMMNKLVFGQISQKQYDEYIEQYNRAFSKEHGMNILREQLVYLEGKHAETGVWGWLTDTYGYEQYFSLPPALPLYAALLIFGVSLFCVDFQGKGKNDSFAQILFAAKKGRKETFRAKIAVSAVFSLAASLAFYGVQMLLFFRQYGFSSEAFGAPLFSSKMFANYSGSLTLGQYLLLVLALRLLAALLVSLFVASLSALLRRLLPSLFVSVLSLGIPSALALTGAEVGRAVNIAGWLDCHTLALFSMEKDLAGSDLGYLLLFTATFAALTVGLLFAARRKFVK